MTTKKWKPQDRAKLKSMQDDVRVLETQKNEVQAELQSEIIAAGIMPVGYTDGMLDMVINLFIDHKVAIEKILKDMD